MCKIPSFSRTVLMKCVHPLLDRLLVQGPALLQTLQTDMTVFSQASLQCILVCVCVCKVTASPETISKRFQLSFLSSHSTMDNPQQSP